MTDLSIAFNKYIKMLNAIENAPDIKKPAKVDRDDFDDDVEFYLAKAEEAKIFKLYKEELKKQQIDLKHKKEKTEKKFKDILFSHYSRYPNTVLEKLFQNVKKEEDDKCNWLTSFQKEVELIDDIIKLNKS